ncbi:unnamed protein product [Polarella glacialis]|uniref:Uncharacterized protein n=1 Tax=Polarella glacialis TaxID=89957 RepID=A0A813GYC9_POLGL|nr:unnamed protein product [Polarella glacialis]
MAGRLPEAGELLHAATDALRALPAGILRPVANLVASPPDVAAAASALQGHVGVIAASVRPAWGDFVRANWTNGKRNPSTLVCEATQAAYIALSVLVRLFKIQCRKLDLRVDPVQLYLSPSLAEALQICRSLPSTSQDDVDVLLKTLLDQGETGWQDAQRGAVRALLYEASPSFAEAAQEANASV